MFIIIMQETKLDKTLKTVSEHTEWRKKSLP